MYPEPNTQPYTKGKIIFIVEDNETYSRSLKTFISNSFTGIHEIDIFPIGEMCVMELSREPDIIIIDYFLNSKHAEANNGLEIIKRIKLLKPNTNIIVLSTQEDIDVISETIKQYDCTYIPKNQAAYYKIKLSIISILSRAKPSAFKPLN